MILLKLKLQVENEVNENEIPKNDVSYVEEKSNENPLKL